MIYFTFYVKILRMKHQIFNKALKILLATNALILVSAAMLGPIYAIFVAEIGGTLLDASLAGSILALTAGVVTLLSGRISDKIKHSEFIMIAGYLLIGTGFFLYRFVDSILFLLVIQVIIGIGEAIYSPAFDKLYSLHLEKGNGGTEWGAWESMNYFSIAVGALIGGFIVSHFGFYSIFLVMGSLSYFSAFYLCFLAPKRVL